MIQIAVITGTRRAFMDYSQSNSAKLIEKFDKVLCKFIHIQNDQDIRGREFDYVDRCPPYIDNDAELAYLCILRKAEPLFKEHINTSPISGKHYFTKNPDIYDTTK